MVTAEMLYKKYGNPETHKNMVLWEVPVEMHVGKIPKRIYCNRDMIVALSCAFMNLINRKFVGELESWDGCHNIRPVRGYEKKYTTAIKAKNFELAIKYLSIHAWGTAVDCNAKDNGIGKVPKLSAGFVKCFTDAEFDWGGNFKRLDGMHFQLAKIDE